MTSANYVAPAGRIALTLIATQVGPRKAKKTCTVHVSLRRPLFQMQMKFEMRTFNHFTLLDVDS